MMPRVRNDVEVFKIRGWGYECGKKGERGVFVTWSGFVVYLGGNRKEGLLLVVRCFLGGGAFNLEALDCLLEKVSTIWQDEASPLGDNLVLMFLRLTKSIGLPEGHKEGLRDLPLALPLILTATTEACTAPDAEENLGLVLLRDGINHHIWKRVRRQERPYGGQWPQEPMHNQLNFISALRALKIGSREAMMELMNFEDVATSLTMSLMAISSSNSSCSSDRLDEYAFRRNKIIESKTTETNKTVGTTNEATIVKPKSVNETVVSKSKIDRDEVIIEDWTSDGNPEILLQDHAVVVSGCSSQYDWQQCLFFHNYEDFNWRLYELKFNLFSVSQMCDKKNSVLFTGVECLILSPSFKLLDESQVVLRAPRKDGCVTLGFKEPIVSFWRIAKEQPLKCFSQGPQGYTCFRRMFFLIKEDKPIRCQKLNKFWQDELEMMLLRGTTADEFIWSILEANTIDASTLPNVDLPIDPNMPDLEDASDTLPNDGIFNGAYDDDKDVGAVADFNNMDNTIVVSPIPTLRIHKDHPKGQILGDPISAVQTRGNIQKASLAQQALVSYHYNRQQYQTTRISKLFVLACFLSQDEPRLYHKLKGLNAGLKQCKVEFLQVQLQQVWITCRFPFWESMAMALVEFSDLKRMVLERYHSQNLIIDKTLFIKKNKSDIMLVQVYVDDIIFGSTTQSMCTEFEDCMHKRFQMSSMGELTFFLGLQVKQQPDGIFISQDKYVADILKKFDFCSIKTATTPIESNKPLVKDEDGVDVDVHVYRSMIGSLMYLTASRPDIMFAVCACARFQVTPKASHLNAVKRIFRYLKHQPKLGLWYPRDSPFELEAFSDSDYGGASLDRKSTTGGCQFLGRRLISWQCKKQTIMANSTTEAEYVAAANCCGQVLWIQNQMMDYGFNFMNTKIHIDNESTICIVKNPVYHSRTKHIEIRHHFIRDCYEKRLIDVIKIHTDANVADLLTKGFDVTRFNFLVANLVLPGKFDAARQIWCCQANLVLPGKFGAARQKFVLLVTVTTVGEQNRFSLIKYNR
ncbi:putative ribonuclease H-like domain-containing protein [Tanacetum coccineum]